MKVAQVAPLYEAVPPRLYGGTERIVHYLTEELVEQGHEVSLFASGDSVTRARLIPSVGKSLRLNPCCVDPLAHHIVQMKDVIEHSHEFDVVHFHTDYLHYPFTDYLKSPAVTTLHGRLDICDLQNVYNKFSQEQIISISYHQRIPLPQANWTGNVYHGLPLNLHHPGSGKGKYLAFLGRVSPEKGLEQAIEIAIASNHPIKIAAKIDKIDELYFETCIKKLLGHPLVEFLGEINEKQKTAFLGDARALLFPIRWEEPFGLVMIEAMACGTPVIAFREGSVPEIIDDGVSGYIVNDIASAIEAVYALGKLSRAAVRRKFEERFTASRMASDYICLYQAVIENNRRKQGLKPLSAPFALKGDKAKAV